MAFKLKTRVTYRILAVALDGGCVWCWNRWLLTIAWLAVKSAVHPTEQQRHLLFIMKSDCLTRLSV